MEHVIDTKWCENPLSLLINYYNKRSHNSKRYPRLLTIGDTTPPSENVGHHGTAPAKLPLERAVYHLVPDRGAPILPGNKDREH
jgi:hypothetical protein